MSAFKYVPKRADPFVFVHHPKAAGTSIRHGLLSGLPVRRKLDDKGTELWPWDRSFMILRDPVDRFLSGWGERASNYGLDDLLSLLGNESIPYNPPHRRWVWDFGSPMDIRHHLLPLSHEVNFGLLKLCEESGSWVSFDCLDEGIEAVVKWLDLIRPPLAHKRKGTRRKSAENLPQSDLLKIREFLSDDYEIMERFKGGYGGAMLES